MKKMLILGAACFLSAAGFAQTEKGKILVGGDASFASSKHSESDLKITTLNFNPNAGYFFMDNLAGGLRLQLGSETTKFGDFKNKSNAVAVAPFVRYYFVPLSEKIKLFGDASYSFGSQKEEAEGEEEKTKYSGFTIAAGPAFFLTENTALELNVFYNSTKIKDVDGRNNIFGVGLGFQIHL